MNTTQLEFKARAGGKTQAQKVYDRLAATPGEWVPMPELVRVSSAYAVHSRINDLRKAGEGKIEIDQMTKRANGQTHSFYKLEFLEQP